MAHVAFGLNVPLHFKGVAPARRPGDPRERPPLVAPLHAVRRGRRTRLPEQATADRTAEELERMLAAQAEHGRAARALARLFGPDGCISFDRLHVTDPGDQQRLLRLLYRALAQKRPGRRRLPGLGRDRGGPDTARTRGGIRAGQPAHPAMLPAAVA